MVTTQPTLDDLLEERFGRPGAAGLAGLDALAGPLRPMLDRRSCRSYASRPVEPALLHLVLAAGFSMPTKSDLQQADVVRVADAALREQVLEGVAGAEWMLAAPEFLVVCADGARLAGMFERTGRTFPNDHFDAAFNAVVDASLVLGGMVAAAALLGLGTCPVSQIRNDPERVDRLLRLPPRVIPVAGLCLGWPAEADTVTPRLGLDATVHEDHFGEGPSFAETLAEYEARRRLRKPYRRQRAVDRFGEAATYGWEEDKTRQYTEPQRQGFGTYVRRKGFKLD
ncbi:nitroreductase family protein [Lutibaculum baratangense]|uniref:Nitroreductase n=1 Tax=Lutibaculum baratangense AMV1 TaxID=631454 RepID=V4RJY7_9HYPH|nr:nitroreductase family protein [Lutibaculum baratangense]ESR25649.1 nitroreductase [Lutibaculum baratangense AMV1]